MKLLIQTSTVQLYFTCLLYMWLFTHAGIKFNPSQYNGSQAVETIARMDFYLAFN